MRIDLQCPAEVWQCKLPATSAEPCVLILYNLGDQLIVSAEVTLVLVDRQGKELQRLVERVRDLKGAPQQSFQLLLGMPEDAVSTAPARMEVTIEKLWYENGTVWRRGRNALVEYQTNALPRGRELNQLRRMAGADVIGYPQQQGGVWLCVCGRPNANGRDSCVRCSRSREAIFTQLTPEAIAVQLEREQERLEAEKQQSRLGAGDQLDFIERGKSHHWLLILLCALVLAGAGFLGARLWLVPYLDYMQAEQYLRDGDYTAAQEAFAAMGDYRDSAARLLEARYAQAAEQLADGEYETARDSFLALGSYSDSAVQAQEADYRRAAHLLGEGRINEAQALFQQLGTYRDSAEQVRACAYQKADELYAAGRWEEAQTAYLALGDYSDSAAKAQLCLYTPARQTLESGEPDAALTWLNQLPEDYKDVAALRRQAHYQVAELLLEEDPIAAGQEFLQAGSYQDAQVRAQDCLYQPAVAAMRSGEYETAAQLFAQIPGYLDADDNRLSCIYQDAVQALRDEEYKRTQTLIAQLPADYKDTAQMLKECVFRPAMAAFRQKDWAAAAEGFETLGDYKQADEYARKARYSQAHELYLEGAYAEAYDLFVALGKYRDSESQAKTVRYAQANKLKQEGRYAEAEEIYTELGSYRQSASSLKETRYARAAALLAEGDYTGAREIFAALGDYADSKQQLLACDYQRALALETAGTKDAAAESFAALGDYADSAARAQALWYELAQAAYADGNLALSAALFSRTPGYEDSDAMLTEIQSRIYTQPAELALAAMEAGNAPAAAYLLDGLDLTLMPEHYGSLQELYVRACYTEGKRLMDAGEPELAYPYLQRCPGYEDTDTLTDRTDWRILGTWRSDEHTLIFRKSGAMTLDGTNCTYTLDGYSILSEGTLLFKLSKLSGDQLLLRDLRDGKDEGLSLRRTASDELQPLPVVLFATQTDLPEAAAAPEAEAEAPETVSETDAEDSESEVSEE
ncbi:MAG: hypothetical protein IKH38_02125 [Clostridia bacterium]|nr:hypothetical protein [Clostridia bacterium]